MTDGKESFESLERRVASLEATVRALTEQASARARQSLEPTIPPMVSQRPPSPPEPARASLLPTNIDFESLIGRYGTLLLATVSALAAVGLFLGWAIERGLLGPTQRIGLGLLTAAGLAVGGLRLRRRERSFGASLLGLALAMTHVCAWSAGPSLKLVPEVVAFLLAALASIALAIFARIEDDEPLWSVGFSGAAIAPFVTSSGKANLVLLAAYGIAVLAAAGYAMSGRRWLIAGRLFLAAALLFTGALATGREQDLGPLLAMGFPLGVALAGVVPWTDGWRRRERLRALGALAALAAGRSALGTNHPYDAATIAALIAGAGVIWLALVDRTHRVTEAAETPAQRRYEADWLDAGVLPLGFLIASVVALDATARGSGVAMAAAAGVILLAMTRLPEGGLRDASAFTVVTSLLVAVLLLLRGRPLEITAAVAGLAAACFAANLAWRSTTWTTMGLIGLAWGALATTEHLTNRPAYQYDPFATKETLIALGVLAAIAAAWRFAARDQKLEPILRAGVVGWVFIWVHQEILFAYNRTVATLLRVTYYATTSVTAVAVGRGRKLPWLRHLGLALAVMAAGTALYNARNLGSVGARIGADLVAAVFLLAIAYWYRRPGGSQPVVQFREPLSRPSRSDT